MPSQNGVVERMNRTIVEMGRTMLAASGLPRSFWALAMDTAVYMPQPLPDFTSLDAPHALRGLACGSKPRIKPHAHLRLPGVSLTCARRRAASSTSKTRGLHLRRLLARLGHLSGCGMQAEPATLINVS